MFLRWFFPNFSKKKVDRSRKISWEASQFLYYIWRKISHERQYRGTSTMIHTQYTHYAPIKKEVEYFLKNRGYRITYFNGVCGRLEIIINW